MWPVDHDERLSCYCRRVEEFEVVLLVVVALELAACDGRKRRRKSLVVAAGALAGDGEEAGPDGGHDELQVVDCRYWWRTEMELTAPSGREKLAGDEEDDRERWLLRKNLACYGGWLVGDMATYNNGVVATAGGLAASWWLVGNAGEGGKGSAGCSG
uniref:Uncharacterized protein n=1 Tax=Salix viminalis TaxID=40686 RepID=A0A6N2MT53_SALVM